MTAKFDKYDYETVVDRRNTGSFKYAAMYAKNPKVSSDTVPLNTADMEIKSPPELYEGLADFLKAEPILGYTGPTDAVLQAIVDWMKNQHDYSIEKEWIVHTPGVVNAFHVGISAVSEPGDGVIIFKPIYFPFGQAIKETHRTEVNVPLIEKDGYYTIDFEAFEEAAAKPENTVLLFCSPHNPVGRVWTREELEKVADICYRHDLYIISDEIWFEFTNKGHEHIMFGRVNEKIIPRLIICTAMTKSFNVAGLSHSHIIIPDDELRSRYNKTLADQRQKLVNAIGYQATQILYRPAGAEWLAGVKEVIYTNMDMVKSFFEENYPQIKAPVSEGTYLQWVDFRGLGLSNEALAEFLDKEAEFFTEHGHGYGAEGSGFERINCAVPRHVLQTQLERLEKALKARFS